LHVQGDARVGPSGGQYILFAGGSTNNIISRDGVSGTSGNALAFSTGTGASAESMRIDTSGNVGIGVTSPAQKLQVTDGTLSNFYVAPGYNSGQGTTLAVGGGEYIEFATNGIGNPRARIDSSGRLLVGTSTSIDADSSIQAFTTGVGSSVQVGRFSNNDGGCNFWLLKSRGGAVGTNAIVQSGDLIGNLGYRAADGTGYNTAAEIRGEVDGTPGVDDMPGRLVFSTTADGASSPTERIVIDSSGQVGIGDSVSAGVRLRVKASSRGGQALNLAPGGSGDLSVAQLAITKFDNNTTTSQYFVQFNINNGLAASGRIVANGANQAAFASTSDVRLKENIQDLPSQLDSILSLRPVEFDYVESEGGGHQIGFIAQELQQIYPDSVSAGSDENGYLSVTGWSKTEARLVKALQEALAKIETLEQRLTDAGIA